jgi:hypothetical protein
MEHDNPSLHDSAVEHSGDPFLPFDAYLEEPFPHSAHVRHTKIGTELEHEIGEPQVSGEEARW